MSAERATSHQQSSSDEEQQRNLWLWHGGYDQVPSPGDKVGKIRGIIRAHVHYNTIDRERIYGRGKRAIEIQVQRSKGPAARKQDEIGRFTNAELGVQTQESSGRNGDDTSSEHPGGSDLQRACENVRSAFVTIERLQGQFARSGLDKLAERGRSQVGGDGRVVIDRKSF